VVALLSEWGYPRIYASERFSRRGSVPIPTSELGWMTTTRTRDLAIAALQDAIREGGAGIRDADTVTECQHFVDKDGRIEADEGHNDDRVLGLCIAYAVLAHSRSRRTSQPRRPRPAYQPKVSSLTGY
jgi:hypothetical protein